MLPGFQPKLLLARFDSELISIGQTAFLAIERFDRVVDGTGVSLIHQEDAAQALGLGWNARRLTEGSQISAPKMNL